MFQSATTLIVGAGASFDYGLPSGPELWTSTKRKILDASDFDKEQIEQHLGSGARVQLLNAKSPTARAIMQAYANESAGDKLAGLHLLASAVLEDDVHSSVDDFLLDNPSLAAPIKAVVATYLLGRLYTSRDGRWIRKHELVAREIRTGDAKKPIISNWCRVFVGQCRDFLRESGAEFPVTVINFNYDRVLETVMQNFWDRTERPVDSFGDCFRFIYPYGCFSSLPEEINRPDSWLAEQSQFLGFAGGSDPERAAELHAIIDQSRTIFMVGFSCGTANANLLGLSKSHGARIFYQNFGNLDTRLNRTLAKFDTPSARADIGSCSDLIANGFFWQDAPPGSAAQDAIYGHEEPPHSPVSTARKRSKPKLQK